MLNGLSLDNFQTVNVMPSGDFKISEDSVKKDDVSSFSEIMRKSEHEIKNEKKDNSVQSENTSETKENNAEPLKENKKTDVKEESGAAKNADNNENIKGKENEIKDSGKKEKTKNGKTENIASEESQIKKPKEKKIKFDMIIDLEKLENPKDKKTLEQKIKDVIENINKIVDTLKKTKKEDAGEIENMIAMLTDLKIILESALSNKDLAKDIKSENIKEKLNSIIKDMARNDLSANETKNIADSIKNQIEKIFDNIQKEGFENEEKKETQDAGINTLETKQSQKIKAENSENINVQKENSLPNEKGTDFSIVKTKDALSVMDAKGENAKDISKPLTASANSSAENINKFHDMLSRVAEKAKLTISEGKTDMIIALKPEHLGNVRMKVTMEGENLYGKIFVDNAEIKDIFTKNLDTIISSLKELNVNIEGFDVALRQGSQGENEEGFSFSHGSSGTAEGISENYIEDTITLANYRFEGKKVNIVI